MKRVGDTQSVDATGQHVQTVVGGQGDDSNEAEQHSVRRVS
jgi:hypothetical protein